MNDHVMEQAEAMVVTDVRHYAVDIDENGNEVRREIPAFDIPTDSEANKPAN